MRSLAAFTLLFACGYGATARSTAAPARTLFQNALHYEEQGKLEKARQTFATLAGQYSDDPLAERAKDEIAAIALFEDGQQRLLAGRAGTAAVTFRAVAQVYPESPLAKRAEAASLLSQRREEEAEPTRVRMIEFHNTSPATADEILALFRERELRLAVDLPYHPEDAVEAQQVMVEFLTAKRLKKFTIRTEASAADPHAVKITFTVVDR